MAAARGLSWFMGRNGWPVRSGVVLGVAIALAACSPAGGGPSDDQGAVTPDAMWGVSPGPGFVADAASRDGVVVAVGGTAQLGDSAERPAAWTSADGQAWETADVDGTGRMVALAAPDTGPLVAGGQSYTGASTRATAWVSADGSSWTSVPDDTAFGPAGGCASTSIEDVAGAPGPGFVAVGTEWGEGACGQHAVAWWSPDGTSWTRASLDGGGHGMHSVVAIEDGFVAVGADTAAAGEGTRGAFWFSGDGMSWTMADGAEGVGNAEPGAVAVDRHGVAAVGYSISDRGDGSIAPAAWRSPDGRTWTRLPANGFGWAPEASAAESGPSAAADGTASGQVVSLVLADGLIATDGGLIALGSVGVMAQDAIVSGGGIGWRYLTWIAPTDDAWSPVPSGNALVVGESDAFVGGPSAVIHGDSLLLFGETRQRPAADQPPTLTPTIWSTDATEIGLGPDVMQNAWWKNGKGVVEITAAPDAGGPLSAANCPTLDEAAAAVPLLTTVGEINAVPFKSMLLQCSYGMAESDVQGRPAGVSILVFDATDPGVGTWASVRTDPSFPNPREVPGVGTTAFATGDPGHEDLWVVDGSWALHMGNSRQGGVPLEQMAALARVALESLQRPPR